MCLFLCLLTCWFFFCGCSWTDYKWYFKFLEHMRRCNYLPLLTWALKCSCPLSSWGTAAETNATFSGQSLIKPLQNNTKLHNLKEKLMTVVFDCISLCCVPPKLTISLFLDVNNHLLRRLALRWCLHLGMLGEFPLETFNPRHTYLIP